MNIYQICRYGDEEKLRKLIIRAESKGVNISKQLNKQNYFGRTPLHYCFKYNNLNCAQFIIENYEPDLLLLTKNKWNILHDGARFGNFEILNWFLNLKEKRKEIDQLLKMSNTQGSIPLYSAILSEDLKCVQLLYPISPLNIYNLKLHTPLLLGLTVGSVEICHYILDQGEVDILSNDKNLANSLFYCCYYEDDEMLEILKRLLEILRKLNKVGVCLQDKNKYTAMHYSCFLQSDQSTIELLNYYHDHEINLVDIRTPHPLDIENIDGVTPVMRAKGKTLDIIKKFRKQHYL
jgi:ankyrin repeat protein